MFSHEKYVCQVLWEKKKSFGTFTKNYSTLEDGGYDLNMNSYTHSELETS